MADHGTDTTTARRLRPTRLLIAAAIITVALAAATAVQLFHSDWHALAVLVGLLRMACAVLWVGYVVARVIDPETAAYCVGYVDGVARRFPKRSQEQRVTFTDR